jgi:hypothetical protein
VCQPRYVATYLKADICTLPALLSFNLERPVRHGRNDHLQRPAHPNPPINLDRPVKAPSTTNLPEINPDQPVPMTMTMTAQPDFHLQRPVDRTSLTNLDRPVRPPAASAFLNLDRPVRPPPALTDMKDINLEPQISPSLNLERPTIPMLSLDRPGRKRTPINFDFPLRQPAAGQDVQNLNLIRPRRPL